MVADRRVDPRSGRAPAHHLISAGLGQGGLAELPGAAPDGAEQRRAPVSGAIPRQPAAIDISVEIFVEIVVAGHFMPLAALFVQSHPQAPVLHKDVVDAHRQRRADPRERIDHEADQRPVAQPDRCGHVDRVDQLARLGRVEHRRLAAPHAIRRAAHRHGRVLRHHLRAHQPVEQVPDPGEPLLHRRHRDMAAELLDPGGDMQRLDLGKGGDPALGAPAEKIGHAAGISAAGVRIADRGGEKLQEVALRLRPRRHHDRRERQAREKRGGGGACAKGRGGRKARGHDSDPSRAERHVNPPAVLTGQLTLRFRVVICRYVDVAT